jgi:hypothetical protein
MDARQSRWLLNLFILAVSKNEAFPARFHQEKKVSRI